MKHPTSRAMPATLANLLAALRRQRAAWRQAATQAWQRRTRREQALLRLAGVLTLIVLPWVLFVRPALDDIRVSNARLLALQLNAAELQALILDIQAQQGLARARLDPSDLPNALAASLERAGLAVHARRHEAPADPARQSPHTVIELEGAAAGPTLAWLAELPSLLSVRILELDLGRSRRDGRELVHVLDGRIVLTQSTEEQP